jgi:transcriptional regulator with XRE-family HTH domain
MEARIRLKEKLEDLRRERGLTLEQFEEQTQIPKSILSRFEDEDDKTNINYKDLAKLAMFYNVSLDYLFGITDNLQHRHIEIDKLRLTDEAIEALSSGKFNSRLLCELMVHPDFPEFLTAFEVFISRRLSENMKLANKGFEAALEELKKNNLAPEKRDMDYSAIREAVVDYDGYLRFRLTQKFEKLAQDLYESHEKEALSEAGKGYANEFDKHFGKYIQVKEETGDTSKAIYAMLIEQFAINEKKIPPLERSAVLDFLKRVPEVGKWCGIFSENDSLA